MSDKARIRALQARVDELEGVLDDPGVDLERVDPRTLDGSLRACGLPVHGDLPELVARLEQHFHSIEPPEWLECENCRGYVPAGLFDDCPFCGESDAGGLTVEQVADQIRQLVRDGRLDAARGARALHALLDDAPEHARAQRYLPRANAAE